MAIKPIGCRADKEEICLCKSLFETHFISGNKSPEIRGANLAYPWAHKHFNYALDIIVARNLRGKARTSNAGHVLPKKYPQPQMGVALVVDFQGPVVYICKSISLWLWKQFENCFEPFWGKSSDKRLANKETHKLTHASPRTHTHAGPTHTHTETSVLGELKWSCGLPSLLISLLPLSFYMPLRLWTSLVTARWFSWLAHWRFMARPQGPFLVFYHPHRFYYLGVVTLNLTCIIVRVWWYTSNQLWLTAQIRSLKWTYMRFMWKNPWYQALKWWIYYKN